MVTAILRHTVRESGIDFRLGGCGPDIAEWQRCSAQLDTGQSARTGVLFRLLDEDRATVSAGVLSVPWDAIAELSDGQLDGLGLPKRSALSVALDSSGNITGASFRVSYRFVRPDGLPATGVERTGALLRAGGQAQILPTPLYQIIRGVDDLNDAPPSERNERMLAWGKITDLLPGDVKSDEYLRSFHISVASAFQLQPFTNEKGEPDFNPVLGGISENEHSGETPGAEVGRLFSPALAEERGRDFAHKYRGLSKVKRGYSLGANTFVILDPALDAPLQRVRELQSASASERREFLLRPSGFLRESLGDGASDEALDSVFFDEGLSDRVRGAGIWEPKVLPWIQGQTDSWLPAEEMGLRIADRTVPLTAEQIPDLEARIREAQAAGATEVDFDGEKVPATDATLEALATLRPDPKDVEPREPEEESGSPIKDGKYVLLTRDNLEELEFSKSQRKRGGVSGSIPRSLRSTLLPHQVAALRWLQDHWCEGSSGALLADDMGLGKTIQSLAFLAWIGDMQERGAAERAPLLIVAPTGLLHNWLAEHRKHLHDPGLGVALEAFGAKLARIRREKTKELVSSAPSLDVSMLQGSEWVLTTYETLRDYQHSFARVKWAAAVFDECQKIKNPAAGVTEAARAMNINFALMMTGTPVENRLADIWPIIDCAEPGKLGSLKDFSSKFENDESGGQITELKDLLTTDQQSPPIMLRRMKEDHVEGLPDKLIEANVCEMPPRQAAAYSAAVEKARKGSSMLEAIQLMRSVSLHPDSTASDDIDAFVADSARLAETFRILQRVDASREKVLIFCESIAMQDFLLEALPARFDLPGQTRVINGTVPGAKRKTYVDEFQQRCGFDVLLLSPKAGGVGLTLTEANHVIHLSRWWNPAVEDQCTDRVLRIGQKRTVHVYTPIARHPAYGENSFDIKLAQLLEKKRVRSRQLLAPPTITDQETKELYEATVNQP